MWGGVTVKNEAETQENIKQGRRKRRKEGKLEWENLEEKSQLTLRDILQ